MADYNLGQLVFKITGDNSGLKKSVEETKQSASGLGKVLKGIAAVAAGTGLFAFFKKASSAASEAEETASKFNVVFSKIQPVAEETAQSLAKAYGIAITESKALLSATGNLLQGFGLSQTASLKVSEVIQRLSGDLVSLTNYSGGVKGASDALTKALMGETEMAKSLGLALNDTQLKTFGARLGKDTEKMNLQEKAMLRLQLAIDQSKNALGDYAGTSGSFANTMRRMGSALEEVFVKVGKEINPSLLTLTKVFMAAESGGGLFSDGLKGVTRTVVTAIKGITYMTIALERLYNSQQRNTVEFARTAKQAEMTAILENAKKVGVVTSDATKSQKEYNNALDQLIKSANAGDPAAKKLLASYKDRAKEMTNISTASQRLEQSNQGLIDSTDQLLKADKEQGDNAVARQESIKKTLQLQKEADALVAKEAKGKKDATTAELNLKAAITDAATEINRMNGETIRLAQTLGGLSKDELVDVKESLEKGTPAAKNFVEAFSGVDKTTLENLLADMQNFNGDISEAERLSAKWGDTLKKVPLAIKGVSGTTQDEVRKSIDDLDSLAKKWDKLSFSDKVGAVNQGVNMLASSLTGMLSALIDLNNAQLQNTLDSLDIEMQARLEAAGVAEETAVQKAQAELDAAEASGDAAEIAEKQKALAKAQIEDEFAKKKKQAEYDSALYAWELQRAMAAIALVQAPLQAFVSAFIPGLGPLGIGIAAANAALAAVIAGIQYKAVEAAKPVKPKFASGGIVPGNSFVGDKVDASVNSGEMILNAGQQQNLFDMIKSGVGNTAQAINVYLNDSLIYSGMYDATKNGIAMIHPNGVAAR